jgi:hypothetical protein
LSYITVRTNPERLQRKDTTTTNMKQQHQQSVLPTTSTAVVYCRNLPWTLLLLFLLILVHNTMVVSALLRSSNTIYRMECPSSSPFFPYSPPSSIARFQKRRLEGVNSVLSMMTSLSNKEQFQQKERSCLDMDDTTTTSSSASVGVTTSRRDWLTSCATASTPLLLSLMSTLGMLQRSSLLIAHASTTATSTATTTIINNNVNSNNNNESSLSLLSEILSQLQQAQQQLEKVPSLIDKRQWDSVRAVLIVPPLSDCWVANRRSLLLPRYVQLLESIGGDDYAAVQIMEDLQGHLRFLDMAVYNNNFNPIVVEGTTNASPTLIESYYQDPIKEYRASQSALQELIDLSKSLP